VSDELYDSNILTSGKGAKGDDEGALAKGTNPHAPVLGTEYTHGDSQGHDGLVAHHFEDLDQQREAGTLGMWIFLATEVMFIGAIFVAYFTYRLQHEYFQAFRDGSANLLMIIGFVNTLVLLTSSLTVVLAIRAAQMGNKKMVFWHLIFTFILGCMFFGFKVIEYTKDYQEHLWPAWPNWTEAREKAGEPYFLPDKVGFEHDNLNPQQMIALQAKLDHARLFYRFYYSLTGLHAFHMLVGLGIFIFLIIQAYRGKYTPDSHAQVEICGLYWHFVDIVWIFLFPLLYLVR
jgi:cytochrome c oxidase subunit 3